MIYYRYLILFFNISTIFGIKNILVLEEVHSPSHNIWFQPILHNLANKNYNITVLTSNPKIDSIKNQNANIHYIFLNKVHSTIYSIGNKVNFTEFGSMHEIQQIDMINKYAIGGCEGAIKSIGYKTLLDYPNDFKIDLILHDFIFGGCLLGFLHKFNYPPLIALTAFNDIIMTSPLLGNVFAPSVFTHYTFKRLKHTNFYDRLENYAVQMVDCLLRDYYVFPIQNKLLQESIPNIPSIQHLSKQTKLVLMNSHPAIDMIDHYPPNIIGVGGIQLQTAAKPLPKDMQKFMDNATNGVILFSLGTNVRIEMLGRDKLMHIFKAFEHLSEYHFIWKIDSDNLPSKIPENVYIRSWIPQREIMAHQNLKLFITHCGLLSTQEATWFGVPMLGIPIFADQFLNIEKSIRSGVAERILSKDLTSDNLIENIRQILGTPSYRENMKIRSMEFRDQKESPLERAVWWIEWVLRNPNSTQFRSPGIDMNYFQRQSIDVIGFLVILFISICLIIVYMIKKIFQLMCSGRKVTISKRKTT